MNNFKYFLLLFGLSGLAQFGPQQVISTEGDGPRALIAIDLDGDNIKDVITANSFSNEILWFKNMGDGSFGTKQYIGTLNFVIDVFASDLDGDNDMDVLSLSPADNTVVWYENLDGLGSFGPERIIGNDAVFSYTVRTGDLDGDNDMDVISGTDSSGLAWYENLDGNGSFGPKIPINASLPNARSVMAIDLDGDTDLDIVSSSSGSVTVSWYENLDGNGTFGPPRVIAGSAPTVQNIFLADIDGDLDYDVLAATNSLNKVAWFENLDGLGNFGPEKVITLETIIPVYAFSADLDNDFDMDVLSASAEDDKIAWFENLDGQGTFGPQQVITTSADSARGVHAADLDNDGDQDVLSVSLIDDKLAWYENLTILGVNDIRALGIRIYPNPVKEVLVVESPNAALQRVTLYTLPGNKVLEATRDFDQIPLQDLASGVLMVQIETEKGTVVEKIVKE
ncbi:MAG: T9SS type A sorting domain-containing protein [Flavobacteriaceae bacterium]